jgi:hypothetical protein
LDAAARTVRATRAVFLVARAAGLGEPLLAVRLMLLDLVGIGRGSFGEGGSVGLSEVKDRDG